MDAKDSPGKLLEQLRAKKEALELKINEKCFELKRLCISEAELTGVIPMEIPLDTDESPPKLKRRIRTMYPYTDDMINQLERNQFPCLPSKNSKSPKRKTPLGPWNERCITYPPRSPGSSSVKSKRSPKSLNIEGTWSGAFRNPDNLQTNYPKTRSGSCRTKLNTLFRHW